MIKIKVNAMNRNKIIFLVVYGIQYMTTIQASVIEHYKQLLDATDSEIATTYRAAKSIENKFEIGLITGHFDYLESLPNTKNWLSNALFKPKNTVYVNNMINQSIDPVTGGTPLHTAMQIAGYYQDQKYEATIQKNLIRSSMYSKKYHNMIKTIQFLIENGADINAKNNSGQTALHIAYKNGDHTATRALLVIGADSNIKDNKGRTPFQCLSIKPEIDPKRYKIFKNDFETAQEQNKINHLQEVDEIISNDKILQKASKRSVIPLTTKINQQNKSDTSEALYQDNMADSPSFSSETTQTISIRSDRTTRLTRDGYRKIILQPEASTASIEDKIPLTTSKSKPSLVPRKSSSIQPINDDFMIDIHLKAKPSSTSTRPSTATPSMKKSSDSSPLIIDQKIEVVQQITKKNTTTPAPTKTTANAPKQKASASHIAAKKAVASKLEILQMRKTSFSAQPATMKA